MNMVASRWGLDSTGVSSDVGAFVSIAIAAVVSGGCALIGGVDRSGLGVDSIARYAAIGAIAPGAAQSMFLASIRAIELPALTATCSACSLMLAVESLLLPATRM